MLSNKQNNELQDENPCHQSYKISPKCKLQRLLKNVLVDWQHRTCSVPEPVLVTLDGGQTRYLVLTDMCSKAAQPSVCFFRIANHKVGSQDQEYDGFIEDEASYTFNGAEIYLPQQG